MAKLELKTELFIATGGLVKALEYLRTGLVSHGVEMTPELEGFICDWVKCNTVTSTGSRITDLSRRLSEYECVDHETPDAECEDCSRLVSDDAG